MKAKPPTIAALVAVALIGLAGCGSSDDNRSVDPVPTTSQSATASATTMPATMSAGGSSSTMPKRHQMSDMVMIDIKDFMYTGTMKVKPGEMVMVTNDDSEAHTITSDQAGLFAVTVQAGATAMFDSPSKAGTYAYHCDFHANMHGSLAVS